jgi:hypothetical protein
VSSTLILDIGTGGFQTKLSIQRVGPKYPPMSRFRVSAIHRHLDLGGRSRRLPGRLNSANRTHDAFIIPSVRHNYLSGPQVIFRDLQIELWLLTISVKPVWVGPPQNDFNKAACREHTFLGKMYEAPAETNAERFVCMRYIPTPPSSPKTQPCKQIVPSLMPSSQ